MKKTILGTMISACCFSAVAGDFTVLIDKKNSNYVHATTSKETTDWVTTSTSCVFNKEANEYYYGVDFQQTETCTDHQERETIVKTIYPDGSEKEISRTNESQNKTLPSTTLTKQGTHLEMTCEDILNEGFSIGDNNYVLSQSGNPTVYCDMTRNGGGWMRVVNHDWYSDKTVPNSQFQLTSNRTITDSGGVNRALPDGFWVNDWISSTGSNPPRWKIIEETPIYAWEEIMVDLEGLAFRSLDGWHPSGATYGNSGDVNSQYLDGFSLTYGEIGSAKHLHSFAVGHYTDYDIRDANLGWLNGDYTYTGQASYFESNTAMVSSTGLLKAPVKSKDNEKISLRLMSDQSVYDETIGLRKYILWVR